MRWSLFISGVVVAVLGSFLTSKYDYVGGTIIAFLGAMMIFYGITIPRRNRKELDPRMVLVALLAMFLGLAYITASNMPPDFTVEAEYLTGMLTASAIVFGFWTILIHPKPEERTAKWLYEEVLSTLFFLSLGVLVVSVILIYLAALNKLYSAVALFFAIFSFLMNVVNVSLALHSFKFREQPTNT